MRPGDLLCLVADIRRVVNSKHRKAVVMSEVVDTELGPKVEVVVIGIQAMPTPSLGCDPDVEF